MDDAKGTWPEELPNVLWAYITTARTPTGGYGTEAVILVEVRITSIRRKMFHKESNDDQLKVNLDYLDKVKDGASNKMTKY